MAWLVCLYVIGIVAVSADGKICPVWFDYNSTHDICMCGQSYEGYITCIQEENITILHLGMAIGYKEKGHQSGTWVASIPYVYPNRIVTTKFLEINLGSRTAKESREYLCESLNRTVSSDNTFCGKCNSTYGPALYSYGMQCAKCKWSALPKYLALQILPISVLYAAVLIFKIDLTRPNIFHYVIFCNVVTSVFRYSTYVTMSYFYSPNPLPVLTKIALTMSGVWSLDFFRFVVPPFCFSDSIKDSSIPFFEFYPAAYLLVVTLLITVLIKLHSYKQRLFLPLWRPVHKLLILTVCKRNRNPWEALSHTYATFFFLYFGKIITAALVTAMRSSAISQNSTIRATQLPVNYDPTVTYFDAGHIAVLMAVFLTATVLITPAVLLLLVFHTEMFQKFYHAKVGLQWQIKLRVFVHTLQNGYKDGSQGTRDYRQMAGGFFLVVTLLILTLIVILRYTKHSHHLPWPVGCVMFVTLALTYGTLRPYKKRSSNNMAMIIYGALAILAIMLCFTAQRSEGLYHDQRHVLLTVGMLLISVVNFGYLVYISWRIVLYFVTYERAVQWLSIITQKCGRPCHFNENEEEQGLLHSSGPYSQR